MILTGDWLRSALEKSEAVEFKLLAVDDSLVGIKTVDFLAPLIEHNLLYGQGSPTRIRFCKMRVEMDEADRVIGERERGNRRERAASPLDLMRRYCADRKTTRKAYLTIQKGRRVFHAEVFEHKPAVKIPWRLGRA